MMSKQTSAIVWWELRACIVRIISLVLLGIVNQQYLNMSQWPSICVIVVANLFWHCNNKKVNTWINNKVFNRYR